MKKLLNEIEVHKSKDGGLGNTCVNLNVERHVITVNPGQSPSYC
jgi:hypothetical protein